MDLRAVYELEFLDQMIRLYSVELLDDNSFYAPVEGRKDFTPQPVEVHSVDEAMRSHKLKKMREQMDRVLSVEKIEAYVAKLLGERKVILASSSDLTKLDNFIRLIYIRLYGQRKRVCYRIVPKEVVTVHGYTFRDFEIWKREKKI